MINFETIYFNTIQYNIINFYQYIVLVAENIAIYCIGGREYCNILYWCLRIVQYNNNSIVPSPVLYSGSCMVSQISIVC